MSVKLTEDRGVRIKQHFRSYNFESVYEFFFHSSWLTRSRPMDSKWSHQLGFLSPHAGGGIVTDQTLKHNSSKDGIVSHFQACPFVSTSEVQHSVWPLQRNHSKDERCLFCLKA